jgi:uncharacterized protein (TIGR02996 family)
MLRADERPFLDAALARPNADAPRLVYADFLEQCEDPADAARGELIRVQMAMARSGPHFDVSPLAERERELIQQHYDRWTASLRGFVAGVEFRCGIPDTVSMETSEFLERGDELFQLLPVRRVHLMNATTHMPQLVQCPHVANVRELSLCWNDLGNGGVNLLVRSPFLKFTDTLDLGFNGIDDVGVKAFADASTLPALRTLALNDNGQITSDGVRALAESPFVGALRTLDLSGNDITEHGVRAIVESRTLSGLESLKLAGNHIGDAGVVALVGSSLFARCLKHDGRLDLRQNTIGPSGATALAACPDMIAISALDLAGNYLGDRGFAALVSSRHFGRVRTLRLGQNQITSAGIATAEPALGRLCRQLRLLDLSGNRLTANAFLLLHTLRGDNNLTLDVSENVHTIPPRPVREAIHELDALKRRITHPAD